MSTHTGAVVVCFTGGFLDGQQSRSGDPLTGGILDYWNAERFYATTAGQVGLFMSGVSPDGLSAMQHPSDTAPTVVLQHRYRVVTTEVQGDVLVIHASYEFATA